MKPKGKVKKNPVRMKLSGVGICSAPADLSQLRKPVDINVTSLKQVTQLLEKGSEEVQTILTYECDIVYECRVCRSLFRSLANFISHKRLYCLEKHGVSYKHTMDPAVEIFDEDSFAQTDVNLNTRYNENCDRITRSQSTKKMPKKDLSSVVDMLSMSHRDGIDEEFAMELRGKCNSSQMNSDNEQVLLEIIDSKKAAYQTVVRSKPSADKVTDSMKTQALELKDISNRNIAILGPDGKLLEDENVLDGEYSNQDNSEINANSTSNNVLTCKMCNAKFSTKKTLTFHMKSKHMMLRMLYPCPCCSSTFTNRWSVYRHLFKVHRKSNVQVRRIRSQIQARTFKRDLSKADNRTSRESESSEPIMDADDGTNIETENLNVAQERMENLDLDTELQQCAPSGKRFERKEPLSSNLQICQKRTIVSSPEDPGNSKRARKNPPQRVNENVESETSVVIANEEALDENTSGSESEQSLSNDESNQFSISPRTVETPVSTKSQQFIIAPKSQQSVLIPKSVSSLTSLRSEKSSLSTKSQLPPITATFKAMPPSVPPKIAPAPRKTMTPSEFEKSLLPPLSLIIPLSQSVSSSSIPKSMASLTTTSSILSLPKSSLLLSQVGSRAALNPVISRSEALSLKGQKSVVLSLAPRTILLPPVDAKLLNPKITRSETSLVTTNSVTSSMIVTSAQPTLLKRSVHCPVVPRSMTGPRITPLSNSLLDPSVPTEIAIRVEGVSSLSKDVWDKIVTDENGAKHHRSSSQASNPTKASPRVSVSSTSSGDSSVKDASSSVVSKNPETPELIYTSIDNSRPLAASVINQEHKLGIQYRGIRLPTVTLEKINVPRARENVLNGEPNDLHNVPSDNAIVIKNETDSAQSRKLICRPCNRRFISLANLRRHIAVHLRRNRYRCSLCDFKSLLKCDCVAHCNMKHNARNNRAVLAKLVIEVPINTEGDKNDRSSSINDKSTKGETKVLDVGQLPIEGRLNNVESSNEITSLKEEKVTDKLSDESTKSAAGFTVSILKPNRGRPKKSYRGVRKRRKKKKQLTKMPRHVSPPRLTDDSSDEMFDIGKLFEDEATLNSVEFLRNRAPSRLDQDPELRKMVMEVIFGSPDNAARNDPTQERDKDKGIDNTTGKKVLEHPGNTVSSSKIIAKSDGSRYDTTNVHKRYEGVRFKEIITDPPNNNQDENAKFKSVSFKRDVVLPKISVQSITKLNHLPQSVENMMNR